MPMRTRQSYHSPKIRRRGTKPVMKDSAVRTPRTKRLLPLRVAALPSPIKLPSPLSCEHWPARMVLCPEEEDMNSRLMSDNNAKMASRTCSTSECLESCSSSASMFDVNAVVRTSQDGNLEANGAETPPARCNHLHRPPPKPLRRARAAQRITRSRMVLDLSGRDCSQFRLLHIIRTLAHSDAIRQSATARSRESIDKRTCPSAQGRQSPFSMLDPDEMENDGSKSEGRADM